jgi:hypothetical protein
MGGMEADNRSISLRAPRSEVGSAVSDELTLMPSRASGNGKEVVDAAVEVYNNIRNNNLSIEDSEQFIKRMQKGEDTNLQRSFESGNQLKGLVPGAPSLKVGLSYLAGSDHAKVTRMEQVDMMKATREPDQMSPLWRVNTAGQILLEWEVRPDLSVVPKDKTPDAATKARRRLSKRAALGFTTPSNSSRESLSSEVSQPLSLNVVNIESDNIKIVHDLHGRHSEFDIESTLIEVDHHSMMNLIVKYHVLIRSTGPLLTPDQTNILLDEMMEDVRRLCHRSPILFRMSTRNRIITSRNTRYGTNNSRQFTTLTTSRGIQEIIGHSASYYLTLNSDEEKQKAIKSRFLQMLVILLSFLNDRDLLEIKEWLEQTYKFRADRASLELLILKVLPLESINPKVFLNALVPAFEGYVPNQDPSNFNDFKHQWDTFVRRMLDRGFLLPGTVSLLGRPAMSWLVDWPKEGFRNTSIFAHLQYGDEYWKTFNEIPRFENMYATDKNTENLTVLMTNGRPYIIRAKDYEGITRMMTGYYDVQPAEDDNMLERHTDLEVKEIWLNQKTREAKDDINSLIKTVNAFVAAPSIRREPSLLQVGRRFRPARTEGINILAMCQYSGRLTKHVAVLGNANLAIAYKLDGSKISLADARSIMMQDNKDIQGVIKYYATKLQSNPNKFISEHVRQVREHLDRVTSLIEIADGYRQQITRDPNLDDDPISKVLLPSVDQLLQPLQWYPYEARGLPNGRLTINAEHSTVVGVRWLQDNKTVEVVIDAYPQHKYSVSPLEDVKEAEKLDQVRVGDLAILAGNYMILAEQEEGNYQNEGLFCTNFLRITSVTVPMQSARGAKRRGVNGQQGGGGQGSQAGGAPVGGGMRSSTVVLL